MAARSKSVGRGMEPPRTRARSIRMTRSERARGSSLMRSSIMGLQHRFVSSEQVRRGGLRRRLSDAHTAACDRARRERGPPRSVALSSAAGWSLPIASRVSLTSMADGSRNPLCRISLLVRLTVLPPALSSATGKRFTSLRPMGATGRTPDACREFSTPPA